MVGVRCIGAALCRSTDLLQPPYFLMFLCMSVQVLPNKFFFSCRMSEKEREDILLQVNNVRYKKNNGQLYLSQTRMGWMMEDADTSTVSVLYNDIRSE